VTVYTSGWTPPRVGQKGHDRYLVEEHDDGTILLTPAVTVSLLELRLLRNPDFVAAMSEPVERAKLRRRPSTRRKQTK
jgi:hypothetical protein